MLTTVILSAEGAAANGVQTLIDAMGNVVSLGGSILNAIIAQPILVFFAAASLVGTGAWVIRQLRSAI